MSPLCALAIRRQISSEERWCLGSVVRMKSSLERFSAAAMSRKRCRVAVGKRARGKTLLLRRLLHLEAVLVGAREEEHVLAVEPLEARDRVGGDRLVGMAEVRVPLG